MRKLLTLIVLLGVFYGGYHLGRQPGAPDLTPFMKKCYVHASGICRRAAQWTAAKWEQINADSTDPALASASGGSTSQEQ